MADNQRFWPSSVLFSLLEESSPEKESLEEKCTGTKNEVIQVAPTPTTPLNALVEWMASGAELPCRVKANYDVHLHQHGAAQ